MSLGEATALAADRWVEVGTPHVRVLSNASPTKAADVAGQIEAFRVALERTWRGLTAPPPEPVTVYAFKSDESFDPYKGLPERSGERILGVTRRDDEGFLIELSVTVPQDIENTRAFKSFQFPYQSVFHEYTHHLMESTISKLPAWVDEGMAEFASTFGVYGGRAELGRPRYGAPSWLDEGFPIPVETLMRLGDFHSGSVDANSHAYVESWMLVFYLTQRGATRSGQFGTFLTSLLSGTPQDEAFAFAFHASPAAVADEAREFFRRGHYTYTSFSIGDLEVPSAADAKTVPARESVLALADLLARSKKSLPQAERTYRDALAASPEDPHALAGLGLVLEANGKSGDAEASYRRAIAVAPDDFTAQFRLGRLLAVEPRTIPYAAPSDPTPPRIVEARKHLSSALLVKPAHAPSELYYGWTYLFEPGDRSQGLVALEAALVAEPENFDAASAAARMRRWAGDRTAAIAALSSTASRHASSQQVGDLRAALIECDRLELQDVAKQKGADAAVAWADKAIAETGDGDMAAQLRTWRDIVRPPAASKP